MASSNRAPRIGLPSSADLATSENTDQILANFQEIFSSQIEPDVVLLIFTECGFNANATLECLFSLIGESTEGKFNKEQSDLQSGALSSKLNKHGADAGSDKPIYKNRLSTIYKSNESLYSEDVALNGEDLNQFAHLTALHGPSGRPSYTQYTNCLDATQKTQVAGLSLSLSKTNVDLDAPISPHHAEQVTSGNNFKQPFSNTQSAFDPRAKWNDISDIGVFGVYQDPISPFSDKSIEADASEQIDVGIGQAEVNSSHVLQPSFTNCNSSTEFDIMAGKQNKKGRSQQEAPSDLGWWANLGQAVVQVSSIIAEEYGDKKTAPRKTNFQGVQQKRNQNPHQNPQAKRNTNVQPHPNWKRHPHQNQKPMSPKEYVMMRIADGHKILVLLRGCPGSGKTTLANEIKFKGVIYSADNFFIRNGEYCFDPGRLPEAHTRNKFLTMRAMQAGRTPIIIDNTNLLAWEMEPYVALAMQNQYYICLLEPSTPWRNDPRQLAMRNTHNISYDRIVNMLQRFDRTVTVRSMIEQYNANNRSANTRPPNMNNETANSPNPIAKGRPYHGRKKKTKESLQASQAGVVTNASGGHILNTSDSDTDSDGWDRISDATQVAFWDLHEPNEKLQKSRSVPNLMQEDICSIKQANTPSDIPHGTALFSCNLIDSSTETNASGQMFEPKLSENMRDLMDLDFSISNVPPPGEIDKLNNIHAEKLPARRQVGRLAATFKDLPSEWGVPEYPSGVENCATDDMDVVESESRLALSQESLASSTASLKQDFKLVSKNSENLDEDATTETNETDQISALKSFFSNVPDEYLKDLYDKCSGDLPWVVDLLLEAGYEMCLEKPAEDLFQKSGSSLEGLAEISPDANDVAGAADIDENVQEACSGHSDGQSNQSSTADLTIQDGQSFDLGKDNKMFLRIDPIFAMQLQEMFGPVGFHLSPASYYGSDLGIFIPIEVARSIHSCWANSLKAKFESEDAEIDKMMDSVALDENYAKRLQEEEDHMLATTLQSDPLGEHFPPLETKHLLLTLEKRTPTTEDLASRIKRQQLYEMFPKIDRNALNEVFKANNASFSEAVKAVEASFCPNEKPATVFAPEQLEEYERALVKFAEQESLLLEMSRTKKTTEEVDEIDYSEPTYDDWRTEASLHYRLRQECFSKAREAYDKGMMAAASFYSQQGRVHSQKLHEANKRASEKILESKNANRKADTLDLHMLHVSEAINALAEFLEAKKRELQRGSNSQTTLRIITGKGNHSAMGVPRIKPAVLEFLTKQNYSHCESNGGLIEIILRK